MPAASSSRFLISGSSFCRELMSTLPRKRVYEQLHPFLDGLRVVVVLHHERVGPGVHDLLEVLDRDGITLGAKHVALREDFDVPHSGRASHVCPCGLPRTVSVISARPPRPRALTSTPRAGPSCSNAAPAP